MATYTQIIYHIVFATKNRERVLDKSGREDLFRYIWGIVKNHNFHLFRLNGIEDHIHILTSVHSTVALAGLVKSVKTGSAKWIKENNIFPQFGHWQEGYGAFTHSTREKDALIEYIKDQEAHHQHVDFLDEYRKLLRDADIEFDENICCKFCVGNGGFVRPRWGRDIILKSVGCTHGYPCDCPTGSSRAAFSKINWRTQ